MFENNNIIKFQVGQSQLLTGSLSKRTAQVPIATRVVPSKEKQCVLWCEVLTGFQLCHFDDKQIMRKTFKYRLTDCLHQDEWPANTSALSGSVILNLDTEKVQDQLERLIDLQHLESDSVLIQVLERYLSFCRGFHDRPLFRDR